MLQALSFQFTHIPNIYFGACKFRKLTDILLTERAKRILLVLGGSSFQKNSQYEWLLEELGKSGITVFTASVDREPSPQLIDETAEKHRNEKIDAVVSIGGGSVIDAGKAISAMLLHQERVMVFLEGAGGGKVHDGRKVPFIAVPTTSGTGSEATKNAVLSEIGKNGFKNSLRHDNFVPDYAILDPKLTVSCPPEITAASGMDAFSQLMESFMSDISNPLTDALALSGIEHVRSSLIDVSTKDPLNIRKRSQMSYAALLSGITLANAGLGVVHGFASSIGGQFDIPHGVICGTMLAEAFSMSICEAFGDMRENAAVINKYVKLAELLCGVTSADPREACSALADFLAQLKSSLKIPGLSCFGVAAEDAGRIALKTSNKNNPVKLNKDQLTQLVINCL